MAYTADAAKLRGLNGKQVGAATPGVAPTNAPFTKAAAITPHATNELPFYARAIKVGGAGNIALNPVGNDDGVDVTVAVVAGEVLNIATRAVRVTGTTATALVALA